MITHASICSIVSMDDVANAPIPGNPALNTSSYIHLKSQLQKAAHIGIELFEQNQDLQNKSNRVEEENEHLKQEIARLKRMANTAKFERDRLDRQNVLFSEWLDELEKEVVPPLKEENTALQSEIQSQRKTNILLQLQSEEVEYHKAVIVERNTQHERTIRRLQMELKQEKQKREEMETEMVQMNRQMRSDILHLRDVLGNMKKDQDSQMMKSFLVGIGVGVGLVLTRISKTIFK